METGDSMAGEQKLKSSEAVKTINMLIYGAPGIGKTHFCSTSPNPYIIDLEDGGLTIDESKFKGKLTVCTNIEQIRKSLSEAIKGEFKTVVFDSLSRYSEILLDDICNKDGKETPGFVQYGEVAKRIRKLCWDLKFKNINVIFTCHEKEIETDNGICKRPALQNSLIKNVPAIMDIVGYLYVDSQGERKISVNPNPFWDAKHRIPPEFSITEPLDNNFSSVYKRLMYRGKK